jgi:hypothetical protein
MSAQMLALAAEPAGAGADDGPPATSTGRAVCPADPARITAALTGYKQRQSGYAVLPGPARHAVLEIGDRMHRLREALRPAPGWCRHSPRTATR